MAAPDTLTVTEFLAAMKIGRTKFYEEVKAGRIATFTIGRRRYITREAVNAFLVDCGFPPELVNADWRPRDPEPEEQAAEPERDTAAFATDTTRNEVENAQHAPEPVPKDNEQNRGVHVVTSRPPGRHRPNHSASGSTTRGVFGAPPSRPSSPSTACTMPPRPNRTAKPKCESPAKGSPPWRMPWHRRAARSKSAAATPG